MPPKRKRADEGAQTEAPAPTRSTRSSTRPKAAAAEPAPAKPAKKATRATPSQTEVTEEEPSAKRKRTTKAATKKETSETGTKRGRKKAVNSDDESTTKPVPPQTPQKATAPPPPAPIAVTKSASLKTEAYTPKRALELFSEYADSDAPNVIGPEGFERLFTDADIPMDGALPLILAWQMNAAEMAKISQEEWVKGTSALKISSLGALSTALHDLDKLLISKQTPLKKSAKSDQDPYDRTNYHSYAANTSSAFLKLYNYCFALAKPEGSRNIDMETTMAFWTVLLVPQYPIMQEVIDFIGEKKDVYRATNKDLWGMMYEFCQTVKPTLEDYEADGAWPTLLDDFVIWKKTNKGANPNGAA